MFDHAKRTLLQFIMNRWFLSLRRVPEEPVFPIEGEVDVEQVIERMELEEKVEYISGEKGFCIKAVPRLGVPPIWMSDATSGLRGVDTPVTAFPSPIAMAASWNVEAVRQISRLIARECRSAGVSILLAPGINIARVPICGRNFEYMGEDPFLAGEIASAYVEGAQSFGVGVTVKHFACNNSEYDRHKSNSIVDEKTLRELYLRAFETVVRRGATGIMTSYNQINGTYASEHPLLIGRILRSQWAFEGLIVSDWNSLYSTEGAFRSGVDLEMPGPRWFASSAIKDLIGRDNSLLAVLDAKVRRILRTADRLGVLRRPVVDSRVVPHAKEHIEQARALARESMVLLKNQGMLPLDAAKIRSVVVLGRFASGEPVGGGGSSFIKQADPAPSLAQRLRELLVEAKVTTLVGRWWKSAAKRAQITSADAVLISTGYDHVYESEAYDRMWPLPRTEVRTIREACALSSRVTVVLHAGGAMEMESWLDGSEAVILAWYGGEESAPALCDLILGRANPSGKLPVTIGRDLADYESMRSYPDDFARFSLKRFAMGQGDPGKRSIMDIHYREGLMVGYRQFDTVGPQPLFPFGFGLSYTTFGYRDLKIVENGEQWHVSFIVRNTGLLAGAEVAQLYLRPPSPGRLRPFQQLRGFRKVFLEAGEETRVAVKITTDDLAEYSANEHRWVVEPGSYVIMIGSGSRQLSLEGTIKI